MNCQGFKSRPVACRGQSLGEYGIILSLITVVLIAGLMLFGQTLNNVLLGMLKGSPSASAATPGASSTPVAGIAITPATPALPPTATPTAPVATLASNYDPKTGMITFQTSDGSTAGKTTTGSQGTTMAAQALLQLAKAAKLDDGSPAPLNVTNMISQLGNLIQQMGQQESTITMSPSKDPTSAAYSQYSKSGITNTYSQVFAVYDQLNSIIGNNPNYSNLAKTVADYSGVAGTTYVYNYQSQYRTSTTADQLAGTIGTNLTQQSLSVPLDPTATYNAGTSINTAIQNQNTAAQNPTGGG